MPTKPNRIPLAQPIQSRAGSLATDSYTQNVVFEGITEGPTVLKRPGVTTLYNLNSILSGTYAGYTFTNVFGVYTFNVNPGADYTPASFPVYIASALISNGPTSGTYIMWTLNTTNVSTANTVIYSSGTTGPNAWILPTDYTPGYLKGLNIPATSAFGQNYSGDAAVVIPVPKQFIRLIPLPGTIKYGCVLFVVYLNSSNTLVVDSTLSVSPGYGNIAYLDGYIFVLDNQSLWNTSLFPAPDQPVYYTSYVSPTITSTSVIIPYGESGENVGLTKHLNYLVVFKNFSFEMYYNNGNPTGPSTPGSPLNAYVQARGTVGCANASSIVNMQQTVFWIGQSFNGGKSVYMFNGVQPQKISTEFIDKFLDSDTCSSVYATSYQYNGHTLYLLTLNTLGITLVFDVEMQAWYTWTYANGTTFPVGLSLISGYTASGNAITYLVGQSAVDNNYYVLQLKQTLYQDQGVNFTVAMVTDTEDWGTRQPKTFGRLDLVCDQLPVSSLVNISHSDDDFQTFSTPRSVDISQVRPVIFQGGRARKRAYKVTYSDNYMFRGDYLEIDVKGGS